MNWKILAVGAALTIPVVWLLNEGFGRDPRALPSVMEGKVAPAFALVTLEGDPVSLADMRGQPVVVNFWATWCVPCAQEHPTMIATARRYEGRGVAFLGVLYGDEPENAAKFLLKKGAAYPTLVDPQQRTAIDFGVAGVPETFFIDKQGMIKKKVVGPVSEGELEQTLEEML